MVGDGLPGEFLQQMVNVFVFLATLGLFQNVRDGQTNWTAAIERGEAAM
jgi:hypothetical protein